jgi:hypothetical protein
MRPARRTPSSTRPPAGRLPAGRQARLRCGRSGRRGHRRCFSLTVVALAAIGIIGPRRRGCLRLASGLVRPPPAVPRAVSRSPVGHRARPLCPARRRGAATGAAPVSPRSPWRRAASSGRAARMPGFVRPLSVALPVSRRPPGRSAGRRGGAAPVSRRSPWRRPASSGPAVTDATDRIAGLVRASPAVDLPSAAGLAGDVLGRTAWRGHRRPERRAQECRTGRVARGRRASGRGANCRYFRSTEAVAGGSERLPEAEPGLIGVSRPCQPAERHRSAAKRVSQDASRRRFVLTGPFAPRKKRQAVVRFGVKQPP